MARWVVHLPEHDASADAYEAVLAPLYAWMHTLVQRSQNGPMTGGAGASARAWVALTGEGRRSQPLRAAALGAGYAAAVAALNAAGRRADRPQPLGRRRCAAAGCSACARCCGGSTSRRRG